MLLNCECSSQTWNALLKPLPSWGPQDDDLMAEYQVKVDLCEKRFDKDTENVSLDYSTVFAPSRNSEQSSKSYFRLAVEQCGSSLASYMVPRTGSPSSDIRVRVTSSSPSLLVSASASAPQTAQQSTSKSNLPSTPTTHLRDTRISMEQPMSEPRPASNRRYFMEY